MISWPWRRQNDSAKARDGNGIVAARRLTDESSQRADQDLAYQKDRAHDERANIIRPLERLRAVNHIAEAIAESLITEREGRRHG